MPDLMSSICALRRPHILIRAARFGLDDYRREAALARLIGAPHPPAPEDALALLIEAESHADDARRAGGAGYSPARHVELLIALMAEARLLMSRSAPVS